jgi:aldehyde:ferredoxin oxidoreductase
VSRAVPAISGWDITFWELMKASERAQTLARCFNLREGFTAEDDAIPRRFSEPFTSGPSKGFGVPLAELERAKLLYYDMMGWDERGVPTTGTLAELDIPWAADILRQAGVKVGGEQL